MITLKVAKLDTSKIFSIEVKKENFYVIRELLKQERSKIVDKFKTYKSAGLIGSISYPRNKTIQDEIDELVYKKRIIKESIEKINKIFNS